MADVSIDIELVTAAFNKALKESGDKVQGFSVQVERSQKGVTTSFNKIEKSAKATANGFSVLKGAAASFFGNLASNAVTALVSSLGDMATSVVDNTIKLEQLTTQFETLTGSATIAEKTLKDLQQFAATTPFQLEGIASAGAQLIGFGTSADELIPRLQKIGDVAASINAPIGELSLIFGQVQAAGKLTGERLLQLEERAVPIGEALAKVMDKPRSAIRRLVSEGKVDFDTFQKAFDSISAEGGQAFEGMVRQSQTLGGLISTLKDNFALLAGDIGQEFLPVFKEAVIAFIGFIESNKEFIKSLAAGVVDKFVATLHALGQAFLTVDEGIQALKVAFNSYLIVLEEIRGAMADFLQGIVGLGEGLLGFLNIDSSGLKDLQKELEITKNSADIEAQALEQDSEAIAEAFNKRSDAVTNFTNKFVKASQDQVTADQAATDTIINNADKKAEAAKAAEAARLQAIKDVQAEFALEEDVANIDAQIAIEEANEADLQRISDLEMRKIEIVRDAELAKAATISDVSERARAEETARQKAKIATIKANNKTEVALEKDKLFKVQQFDKLSNQQRLSNMKSTLGTISSLQSSSSKELFAIGKAAAISTATIDGIAAVQKALSSAPPPFNIGLAALVGVATAANVAKIASAKPPSAGSFQDGGIIGGNSFSGDNLTANVNSGELILNRNQQQTLFNIANGGEASTRSGLTPEVVREIVATTVQGMQVTLIADDTEIARSASRGVSNGVVIGVSS